MIPHDEATALSNNYWGRDPRGLIDVDGSREWPDLIQYLDSIDPEYRN